MKRIRQCLARGHRAERTRVDKLTQHSQSGAGPAHWRVFGIKQEVYAGLHRRSAPQRSIGRLITAGNPQCFRVLNMTTDVSRVRACSGGDDDRFTGIHLRAEILDVRVVSVGSSGPDDDEVTATCFLAHPLKRSVDVSAATHQNQSRTERRRLLRVGWVSHYESLKPVLALCGVNARRKEAK